MRFKHWEVTTCHTTVPLGFMCTDICKCINLHSETLDITRISCDWTIELKGGAPLKPYKIQFVAQMDQDDYESTSLVDANSADVYIEGALRWEGNDPEGYTFDSETGTINFNTPLYQGQRVIIRYFK